jgi:hypothetical protein
MDDMNLFVPITKIDAAQRLAYGVVTAEAPDALARRYRFPHIRL